MRNHFSNAFYRQIPSNIATIVIGIIENISCVIFQSNWPLFVLDPRFGIHSNEIVYTRIFMFRQNVYLVGFNIQWLRK